MALKLTWKNNNVVANTIKIYRGDAKLDPANLPAPLVELTQGETEWVDATAVYGKTYFYILAVVTANDFIPTANQQILVADNRGAGPSTLMYGDDNMGYFGQVLTADFLTNLDIVAAAITTAGLPTTLVQAPWHKFVRKGKILYMPAAPFGQVTYNALYAAGLVYGVNASAPPNASIGDQTAVNQYRPIEFKGQKYIPRLMRGFSDGPQNDWQGWNWAQDSIPDSISPIGTVNEFNDLFFSTLSFVPECQRTENYAEGDIATYVGTAGASYDDVNIYYRPSRIICQERNTANVNVLARARRSWSYGGGYNTVAYNKNNLQFMSPQSPVQSSTWVPVLELEPQTATVALKG